MARQPMHKTILNYILKNNQYIIKIFLRSIGCIRVEIHGKIVLGSNVSQIL